MACARVCMRRRERACPHTSIYVFSVDICVLCSCARQHTHSHSLTLFHYHIRTRTQRSLYVFFQVVHATHAHTDTHLITHTHTRNHAHALTHAISLSHAHTPEVISGALFLFFPCNHIINIKKKFFSRRSKRQRNFCIFFTS
jgi:mannose-1-phosphate guanylyltransferase